MTHLIQIFSYMNDECLIIKAGFKYSEKTVAKEECANNPDILRLVNDAFKRIRKGKEYEHYQGNKIPCFHEWCIKK